MHPISQPLTVFLIGVTGDLSKKKILRAFFELYKKHILDTNFTLIGIARKAFSQEDFREFVRVTLDINENSPDWKTFSQSLFYISGDVSDRQRFKEIKKFHSSRKTCGNHLWYVATLPSLYTEVVKNIRLEKLQDSSCGWTKLLLEKPFGIDLESSRKLNTELLQAFREDQIYRIDHFLAKETVQNLLAFRFANGLFETMWNAKHIDNIQITATETMGIGERAAFYDQTGATRDYFQNHVLQMLATTLMEEPEHLSAEAVRSKRRQLLSNLRITEKNGHLQAFFGQYESGTVNDSPVAGYKQETNISGQSVTETAVAIECEVDSERWRGVPIYLRHGKRMRQAVSEITIVFKEPKNQMFSELGGTQPPNVLTLRIQPNEGIIFRFNVKKPGLKLDLQTVPMQFCYNSNQGSGLVEAYEKLLYDAISSDPMFFPEAAGIEESWKFVEPLLQLLKKPTFMPEKYVAGSWGPASFDKLLPKNKTWIEPNPDLCQIIYETA
ncbi:MAG: glucose-6-phosphate dehydrogenase [Candidatus Pacebacteria bacterium CG10_big_fil_rev_8_21_14_0_10_42_12]|nr:glucose-6-phosphate dehydrogenase [Candidatus Paceibacterota bacterium]PIR62850.1 MAG: glucose-6-phosphate dehydrogenase [Candidatus Pacebacteria bacterium CG10_big_fil_rev_8_21_14_0_10_42_12]